MRRAFLFSSNSFVDSMKTNLVNQMKIQTYFVALATIMIMSCGGSGTTTEQTSEATIDETAVIDSISIAVDEMKTDLHSETEATVEEIDSLLSDI